MINYSSPNLLTSSTQRHQRQRIPRMNIYPFLLSSLTDSLWWILLCWGRNFHLSQPHHCKGRESSHEKIRNFRSLSLVLLSLDSDSGTLISKHESSTECHPEHLIVNVCVLGGKKHHQNAQFTSPGQKQNAWMASLSSSPYQIFNVPTWEKGVWQNGIVVKIYRHIPSAVI